MTTQTNIGYADTKIKNSLASIRSNEFVCVHLFHRMSAVVWHSSTVRFSTFACPAVWFLFYESFLPNSNSAGFSILNWGETKACN